MARRRGGLGGEVVRRRGGFRRRGGLGGEVAQW